MRPNFAGLMALLAGLGLTAPASASLELADLPSDQTRGGGPPEVPDWRALARAPGPARPAGPPQATLRAAETLPELGHFASAAFLAEIARGQGRAEAEALVLLHGSFDLAGLAQALATPTVLAQDGNVFTLRRPLVIRRGAALVLPAASVLRLATGSRAFLVNGGQLFLRGARITSWNVRRRGPSELRHDRQFRPFVTAIGGSWTGIADSTLTHLGYFAAKSYGLSLVSGPSSRSATGPPTGRVTGSRILGNYYGLYSYEAEGLVITANAFIDNIVYGIDPHDRSRRLVIAGNAAIGTQRKHGIVVSRGVSDSWIVENRAVGNAGTGIVIHADSTDNVVAHNLTGANGGDGLSLFESARNLLWGNLAIGNRKNGLRIRNSWATKVHHNHFVNNGHDGIEAYAKEIEDERISRTDLRLGVSFSDNRYVGNARTSLTVRKPARIDLLGWRRAAGDPPLRLGGDLRPLAAEIEAQLERTGSTRITGAAEGPATAADPPS